MENNNFENGTLVVIVKDFLSHELPVGSVCWVVGRESSSRVVYLKGPHPYMPYMDWGALEKGVKTVLLP